MTQNDIAAVVVTYNRCELLRKNIECLLNQKGTQCDIYVIDNASTDQTQDMVRSFTDSRVHYFNTGGNLGGAGGFEWGMRQAAEDGYRLLWLMDDDTLPSPSALHELIEAGAKLGDNWGALSSAAYWVDNSVCNMNRQKPTLFSHVKDSDIMNRELIPVIQASFVSLLLKSEAVREIGLPYGEYFIWTDDLEYTLRLSQHHKIYVVPKSSVVHAMKDNRRPNFAVDAPDRLARYRYLYRNDVHCYSQYGLQGWIYLAVKFTYTALNVLLHSKGHKLEKLGVLVNGFKEGFSFRPELRRITDGGGGQQNNFLVVAVVCVYRLQDSCNEELEAAA